MNAWSYDQNCLWSFVNFGFVFGFDDLHQNAPTQLIDFDRKKYGDR